ncbi:MAG: RIP metalloprotease RseP [Alphaproteobacteria bacterium]|nr:RIP metalloprotease RseP [Alphaproteobacteria bacterium]
MDLLASLWNYVLPFLVVLTILVFVHELGHYWVARRCGVRVEVFSIGFGPELFGWNDRAGTRWRISAVPLGGYVKMAGDTNAASMPGEPATELTPDERTVAFQYKSLGQRAAIVLAGPAANFLFALIVYALLFATAGQPFTPPEVGAVVPGSAAEAAGLQVGDRVLNLDGQTVRRFEDIQRIVQVQPGVPLDMVLGREGGEIRLRVTPAAIELKDRLGNIQVIGQLGISRTDIGVVRHDPLTAVLRAGEHTYDMSAMILKVVGQMIAGTRPANEIGGILRIGYVSGEATQAGLVAIVNFLALLSINLGLINLFPVPMLDGGHLVFYIIEAMRGRPLGARAQEYGLRVGFALVIALMLFATWNDLVHFRVVEFVRQIVG